MEAEFAQVCDLLKQYARGNESFTIDVHIGLTESPVLQEFLAAMNLYVQSCGGKPLQFSSLNCISIKDGQEFHTILAVPLDS